jgi:hypothetical protein
MPVVYVVYYIVPVPVHRAWRPVSVVGRVVTPVPWRVVRTVAAYPEHIKYKRPYNINRLIYIVRAIHVNITYNLYPYIIASVALYLNGSNVLKSINA